MIKFQNCETEVKQRRTAGRRSGWSRKMRAASSFDGRLAKQRGQARAALENSPSLKGVGAHTFHSHTCSCRHVSCLSEVTLQMRGQSSLWVRWLHCAVRHHDCGRHARKPVLENHLGAKTGSFSPRTFSTSIGKCRHAKRFSLP